jgi:hypothetical protein
VRELVAAHPGKCPLLLCFMRPGGEIVFMDTNERFSVHRRHAVDSARKLQVDTSPPTRAAPLGAPER